MSLSLMLDLKLNSFPSAVPGICIRSVQSAEVAVPWRWLRFWRDGAALGELGLPTGGWRLGRGINEI